MSASTTMPDVQTVHHRDETKRGAPFAIEVTDLRARSGSLCVDVAPLSGEIDDVLGAAFEVAYVPGTQQETACLHLSFSPDAPATSIYKRGDRYLLRLAAGVSLRPTVLPSGEFAYVLEHDAELAQRERDPLRECPIGCDCISCRAAEIQEMSVSPT